MFLKFLALERFARGTLIVFVGVNGLRISNHRIATFSAWNEALTKVSNLDSKIINSILHSSMYRYLFNLKGISNFQWIGLFSVIALYGALICFEGVGLWFDVLWIERLTVITTGAFLPIEAWELGLGFTITKLAVLSFNLFVVIWLYKTKWNPFKINS
jgi:uncharacterized membrane protein (DUF2068 family)